MGSLEFIDSYFNAELPPEQKKQFEKRITEDPAFAEEVAFYVSARKAAASEATDEKKQRFRELYQQNHTVPISTYKRRIRMYAVAAATFGIIVLGWYLFSQSYDQKQLADKYIEKNLQTLGVTMSTSPDSLQAALRLYNDGELQEALRHFEAIIRSVPTDFAAKKYAGIVSLRLEQYDKALSYFKQLDSHTGLFSNPARFYLALTYMKRNQPGDLGLAKPLLQQVVELNLEGKETARQWLNELKGM